jgi:hypothetical protein
MSPRMGLKVFIFLLTIYLTDFIKARRAQILLTKIQVISTNKPHQGESFTKPFLIDISYFGISLKDNNIHYVHFLTGFEYFSVNFASKIDEKVYSLYPNRA